MVDFPRTEPEFGRAWSNVAGRVDGLRLAHQIVAVDAGRYFIEGKDDLARTLRALANRIDAERRKADAELEAYIEEGKQRHSRKK